MSGERRRGLATAAVGAGMLAAGGKLRHVGVARVIAATGKEPKVHGLALLRHGDRPARALYGGGSALGLLGTAPLGVGTVQTARGKVDKREKRSFLREGLAGTGDALKQKGEALRTPVPKDVRAAQLGVAGGTGWAGSALARAALRHHPGAKPYVGPVAGALAGVASLPLSNKAVQSRSRDYVVTAAGVKRAKKPIVRPSSKSSPYVAPMRSFRTDVGKAAKDVVHWATAPGFTARGKVYTHIVHNSRVDYSDFRQHVVEPDPVKALEHPGITCSHCKNKAMRKVSGASGGKMPWAERREKIEVANERFPFGRRPKQAKLPFEKAEDYLGRRTPYGVQRAAVTAARQTPVVGSVAAARTAAHFAPPGQERKAAVRQYAEGAAAPTALGVGAAYGGAHLAEHTEAGHRAAERVADAAHATKTRVRSAVGIGTAPRKSAEEALKAPHIGGRTLRRLAQTRAGAPLFGSPRRFAGAAVAFAGTKALVGAVGDQHAISANNARQRAFNAKAGVAKGVQGGQTKRERHNLARQKRMNAALATIGGSAGLTGLALLPTRHKAAALTASTIGGGVGGLNALIGSRVQRQEAAAIDPVKKGTLPTHAIHPSFGKVRVLSQHSTDHFMVLTNRDERRLVHRRMLTFTNKGDVAKSFVPGLGYRAATKLTAAQRASVAARRGARGALEHRGATAAAHPDNATYAMLRRGISQGESSAHRQITFDQSVPSWTRQRVLEVAPKKMRHPVHVAESAGVGRARGLGSTVQGMTFPGGKHLPNVVLLNSSADRHTIVHELGHAQTVRGVHRTSAIGASPVRLGREEGRADGFAARRGFHPNTPYGQMDYQDSAAVTRGMRRGSPSAWALRNDRVRGISTRHYDQVRAKMGAPSPKMSASVRSAGRDKALQYSLTAAEVGVPLAVGLAATHQMIQEARGRKVAKRDYREPLKTSVSDDDAKRLVREHGLTGPLPKQLSREQRRAAYEARYVSAGGHKAEHWTQRARVADKVKTGGLAVATAAGVPWLASRTHGGVALGRAMARRVPALSRVSAKTIGHHAETVAGAGATVGGAGELYAAHARRKRSSYASAPAGVAASALRRMQAYDVRSS